MHSQFLLSAALGYNTKGERKSDADYVRRRDQREERRRNEQQILFAAAIIMRTCFSISC